MKLLFSSWKDKIVDNRGMAEDQWHEAPDVTLPLAFDAEHTVQAFMGWDGIIQIKEGVDVVDMCAHYMEEIRKQSCGKCFPCRVGTAIMARMLLEIANGWGTKDSLAQLESIGRHVSDASKCYIGKTGPTPVLHALNYCKNDFLEVIRHRKREASRTRYEAKWTAPCTAACPAGMDIPGYVEMIKEYRFPESLAIIREASPMAASLGRACFHPCEKNCRRSNVEGPVSICKLKRAVWDHEDLHPDSKPTNPNPSIREEKVAIIGAGPAGLSAAYYLSLKGYPVDIFESLPVPGGMVGVGIPEYRVPKEVLGREVEFIKDMGVSIHYNVRVGTDPTISSLKDQGYRAFLIATGAHVSINMGVDGEDAGYSGLITGVDYLRDAVTEGAYDVKGKRVIVLGGGNVAMDCCRTPLRKGAKEVTIVYRRTKAELPADPHEVHDSEIEGVKYIFLAAPKTILAENGKVTGLECLRMELGEPDASGRRRPVPVEGSEFLIPADIIIQAIGQNPELSVLSGVEGIQTTRWKTIAADPDTFQTDVPWIFTAGDAFNGPLTIVDACGNAKRAAQSIDQYLNQVPVTLSVSERMDKVMKQLGVFDKDERVEIPPGWERAAMPMVSLDERVSSFAEVETGYTLNQAMEEASRCLRCYQIGMVALEKIVPEK